MSLMYYVQCFINVRTLMVKYCVAMSYSKTAKTPLEAAWLLDSSNM